MTGMRAAIYTRVSSDPKATNRSTTEQETDCRRWAKEHGWDVAGVYTDNDRSASRWSRKDRPDWERLAQELDRYDVLVVWELSRATRDRVVWATLIETAIDLGTKLCVGGRLYDATEPEDAFVLDLGQSLSVRESAVTRKRVLRAMRASAGAGRPHGRVPYGYRRIYNEHTGALDRQVPDEATAPVVREAARRVAAGEALRSVCRDFEERGIPSPAGKPTWSNTTLRRMLLRPTYIGKRVYQGEIFGDGDWPALIDETTFWRLRSLLVDPARRVTRDASYKYLLSGVATCGVCDGPMRALVGDTVRYGCAEKFCTKRRADWVDRIVEGVVVGLLSRPELTDELSRRDPDATAAAAEAAELRARLEGFYDEAADGKVTPAGLARIEARLVPKLEQLEARARRQSAAGVLVGVAGPDAAARWAGLPVGPRRAVVEALVTVRVLPSRPGPRFDPASVEVTPRSLDGR